MGKIIEFAKRNQVIQDFCRVVRKPAFGYRLEIHLADHCNLNCKSCAHFAPLAEPKFVDLNQLEQSLRHLSEIGVERHYYAVHLQGGEPLLCPDVEEVCRIVRQYLPSIKIMLITNGILLPSQSEHFWKAMNQFKIEVCMTVYPIELDLDTIRKRAEEYGVSCSIFADGNVQWRRRPLSDKAPYSRYKNYFQCAMFQVCNQLYDGKLFMCPVSAYCGHLNKAFGTRFEQKKGDYIEVEDIKSLRQIKIWNALPHESCKYCAPTQKMSWDISKREKDEWI